jgi:hypothetical protein
MRGPLCDFFVVRRGLLVTGGAGFFLLCALFTRRAYTTMAGSVRQADCSLRKPGSAGGVKSFVANSRRCI